MPFFAFRPFLIRIAIISAAVQFSAAVPAEPVLPLHHERLAVNGTVRALASARGRSFVFCATSGRSVYAFGSGIGPLWKTDLPGVPVTIGAGPDGSSYTLDSAGRITVLNAAGRQIGSFAVRGAGGGEARGRVSVDPGTRILVSPDGSVFIASATGRISLHTPAGRLLWTIDLRARLSAIPVAPAGATGLILALEDGRLMRISEAGEVELVARTPSPARALVSAAPGLIAASGGDAEGGGWISLFDDETFAWSFRNPRPVPALATNGRDVFALTDRGLLLRFDRDGRLGGSYDFGSSFARADLFVSHDYFGALVAEDGSVAFFSHEPAFLRQALIGRPQSAAALAPGLPAIFAGDEGWLLHRFDILLPMAEEIPAAMDFSGALRIDLSRWPASLDFTFLAERARSRDPQRKAESLSLIKARSERADLAGSLEYCRELLKYLAAEAGGGTVPLRAAAAGLLARIGNLDSLLFLARLGLREREEHVLAAILNGIAGFGSDPGGVLSTAAAEIFLRQRGTRTRLLAEAAAAAIGGGLEYRAARAAGVHLEALHTILEGDYGRRARDKALDALGK